jgi:uncharacterized Ntn-hydrolase superfamily protein
VRAWPGIPASWTDCGTRLLLMAPRASAGHVATAFAGVLLLIDIAGATYSIVGTDRDEALSGISIASCVGSLDLGIAVGMAPGAGVVAAQASVDSQFRGRTLAVELLREGELGAPAILERIATAEVDPGFQSRQYGIAAVRATLDEPLSGDWTGSSTGAWSGGTSGTAAGDTMPYAAQGNILTGPACVEQSEAGFVADELPPRRGGGDHDDDECFDLPGRLMRALRAGAENGEGDTRCTRRDPPVPVDSAYLRVDLPSGEPWLLLSVVNTYPLSGA